MLCLEVLMMRSYPQILVMDNRVPRVVIGRTAQGRNGHGPIWVPIRRDLARRLPGTKGGLSLRRAGIVTLPQDRKRSSRFMLVPPRGRDLSALVLWRVPSGLNGQVLFTPDPDVLIVGECCGGRNPRRRTETLTEILAVLKPGKSIHVMRTGQRTNRNTHGRLTHLGGGRLEIVFSASPLRVV